MKRSSGGTRDPLLPLLLLFGGGVYYVFSSIQAVPVHPGEAKESVAAARFVSASVSPVVTEFLAFKDSSVLFLPDAPSTGASVAEAELPYAPSAEPRSDGAFVSDPWGASEAAGGDYDPSASGEEVLRAMAKPEVGGFGTDPMRAVEPGNGPAEGGPHAIVYEYGSGRARASLPLPKDFHQRFGSALWGPTEYAFYLSDGLPAGPPAPTRSSGNAQVDESLQAHFSEPAFIPALPNGYYLLRVAP